VLPQGLEAVVDAGAWTVPPVFGWLAAAGDVAADEMLRVFNCGIGMVCVVAAERAAEAASLLEGAGETVFRIGHLAACLGPAGLRVENLAAGWPR
jgi:phosphoribosylformylglycinamidine cyclo-ligase